VPNPKRRSSSISGSCTRVRVRWSGRWTGGSVRLRQSSLFTELWNEVLGIRMAEMSFLHRVVGLRETVRSIRGVPVPSGRRPRGRPRTRWRDYISQLVWKRLQIPQNELESVAGVRGESGSACRACCHRDPSPDNQWMYFRNV